MICRQILVGGRVQGVGFREWTIEEARALGLNGWVRNRRDGRVEIVVAGDPRSIDQLVERCRRGPPAARVDNVAVEPFDEAPPTGFQRRPTV